MDSAQKQVPGAGAPVGLLAALTILAGLSVIGGAAAALLVLAAEQRAGAVTLTGIAVAAGCLLAGVVAGCVLWAVAHLVRRQSRLALFRSVRGLSAPPEDPPGLQILDDDEPADEAPNDGPAPSQAEPPPTTAVPELPADAAGLLREVLAEVRELNENLMLSPEQREAKRKVRQEHLRERLGGEARRVIDDGDFPKAAQVLDEFARRVPDDAELLHLRQRLQEARAAAKARDMEIYTQQVQDLMATSSFDRAEETARQLRDRYPDEPDVAALMDRVLREGKMFRAERRERMFREVRKKAEARQWRAALEAAQRFVEAFAKSVDADAVRAMLPTIEDNARIEEVRGIRDQIRDLLRRRRYPEAVAAAEEVIRRFPDMRAATELGRQLHRLRELARGAPSRNGPPGP